jgi:hypothetical protein
MRSQGGRWLREACVTTSNEGLQWVTGAMVGSSLAESSTGFQKLIVSNGTMLIDSLSLSLRSGHGLAVA